MSAGRSYVLGIVAGLVLLPGVVSAQLPSLRVVPRIGVSVPAGDLTAGVRYDRSISIGLGVEFSVPILPLSLRVGGDFTNDTDVRDDADALVGGVSILNVAGDAMLRPFNAIVAKPYLFVGGGLKHHDFRIFNESVFGTSDNQTSPSLHAGGGLEVKLGALGFILEAGDYVSKFEFAGSSKVQNDLYATLGARVGLF